MILGQEDEPNIENNVRVVARQAPDFSLRVIPDEADLVVRIVPFPGVIGPTGPAGAILQTVTATSITQSTTTSGSYTNTPNLSVTITPTSSSSRFLLMAYVNSSLSATTGGWVYFAFARDGSNLGLNTGATVFNAYAAEYHAKNENMASTSMFYVDSPATASAITYTVRWATYGGYTGYLNRRGIDGAFTGRSYFTVLEIA